MTTYHLLAKPIEKMLDGKVKWLTSCGLKVSMPPQRYPEGTVVRTPDKYGDEVIECPACYAGVDETRSDEQIRKSQQKEAERSQQGSTDGLELVDDNFTTLKEEIDEYPEK